MEELGMNVWMGGEYGPGLSKDAMYIETMVGMK
jgi:hypothetical protein